MRVLIDVGHPAHVHLFRCFAAEMQKRGHQILFSARDKEMTYALLEHYHLEYIPLGKHYKTITSKLRGWLKYTLKIVKIIRQFKPDVVIGHSSFYSAQAAFICKVKHISLEDTGNWEQVKLYKTFTQVIVTPECLKADYGNKQIRYPGYHELAYLHPGYFNLEDKNVKGDINDGKRKYIILRLVSRASSHDIGSKILNYSLLRLIIEKLKPYATIFITSEEALPDEFSSYRLACEYHQIHEYISKAALVIGNSATMASEAAVLGVPSVLIDNRGRDYTTDQQRRYGLVLNIQENETAINEAIDYCIKILTSDSSSSFFREKRIKLLDEHINVTSFLVWFVENFPESMVTLRAESSCYQNFR